jgi:hypothetical protein
MPAERGTHVLEAVARRGDAEPLDAEAAYAMVAEPVEEAFDVGLRSALLERLAEESGGRYYTPETAAALARDVVYTESGTTVAERMDLWDMPAVLLVLAGLLGAEWAYRRARGLA